MTIKVGDKLPEGKVQEFFEVEKDGCSVGPNTLDVREQAKGKKIAIFGLPGAFTPTCSAKHVPSYLANLDKLKAKGVDEIWCFAVNDPFVMRASSCRPERTRASSRSPTTTVRARTVPRWWSSSSSQARTPSP